MDASSATTGLHSARSRHATRYLERPASVASFAYLLMILAFGGAAVCWMMQRSNARNLANPALAFEIARAAGLLLVNVYLVSCLVLMYRCWSLIQDGQTAVSPGKAIGFLFVPFLNFVWLFVAIFGLALAMNRYADRHRFIAPRASALLGLAASIYALLLPIPFVGIGCGILFLLVMPMYMASIYRSGLCFCAGNERFTDDDEPIAGPMVSRVARLAGTVAITLSVIGVSLTVVGIIGAQAPGPESAAAFFVVLPTGIGSLLFAWVAARVAARSNHRLHWHWNMPRKARQVLEWPDAEPDRLRAIRRRGRDLATPSRYATLCSFLALFVLLVAAIVHRPAIEGRWDTVWVRESLFGVGFLFLALAVTGWALFLYRAWAMIQDGQTPVSPGLAVGLLFVPVWVFVAVFGLAWAMNRYADRHRMPAPRASLLLGFAVSFYMLLAPIPYFGWAAGVLLLFLMPMYMASIERTAVELCEANQQAADANSGPITSRPMVTRFAGYAGVLAILLPLISVIGIGAGVLGLQSGPRGAEENMWFYTVVAGMFCLVLAGVLAALAARSNRTLDQRAEAADAEGGPEEWEEEDMPDG
jgi:hypothetical protein